VGIGERDMMRRRMEEIKSTWFQFFDAIVMEL
jgi:hypothetical protein